MSSSVGGHALSEKLDSDDVNLFKDKLDVDVVTAKHRTKCN